MVPPFNRLFCLALNDGREVANPLSEHETEGVAVAARKLMKRILEKRREAMPDQTMRKVLVSH